MSCACCASASCSEFQSQLPASGAPALPPQSDQASQLYEEYVRQRTLQNWRFWLVSSCNSGQNNLVGWDVLRCSKESKGTDWRLQKCCAKGKGEVGRLGCVGSLIPLKLQFSTVIKPLFESYTRTVSTGSAKEFCQSVMSWLEQHCTLPILRPGMEQDQREEQFSLPNPTTLPLLQKPTYGLCTIFHSPILF